MLIIILFCLLACSQRSTKHVWENHFWESEIRGISNAFHSQESTRFLFLFGTRDSWHPRDFLGCWQAYIFCLRLIKLVAWIMRKTLEKRMSTNLWVNAKKNARMKFNLQLTSQRIWKKLIVIVQKIAKLRYTISIYSNHLIWAMGNYISQSKETIEKNIYIIFLQ